MALAKSADFQPIDSQGKSGGNRKILHEKDDYPVITQLNKDGARLVAEIAASAKRSRGLETQAEQAHAGLNQARVDQARAEAERDALRSAVQQQADELTAERAARERLAGELAKVTGRLDAQQQLLADYRTQLGVAGPAA
ncbi:hypothetical protein CBM2586_P10004 [Cupriavidus phytorum]|uniref:Uncharacterized protein n=1 Tax=Cupriavidus taiwanensis TaxID=164546 RepID=A0A375CPB2_9BURK|nr:integrase [Cupriavidus taiwanensis]SOY77221.1 hypothetical protein CBM2586_P10004 [Cupriavidus taiwanensis]